MYSKTKEEKIIDLKVLDKKSFNVLLSQNPNENKKRSTSNKKWKWTYYYYLQFLLLN